MASTTETKYLTKPSKERRRASVTSNIGDINRIFIFAPNDGIDMLPNSSQWFSDGTFKLCPKIFSQIYTIHALVNHDLPPCVFALLSSETEIVYE